MNVYDFVSSQESPEHLRKVQQYNMRNLIEQSNYHSSQMKAKKQRKELMLDDDRTT